jgi:uncharacterized protein YydD (DUF2326 family)
MFQAVAGHILAKGASISSHESGSQRREHSGGSVMRAQKAWQPVGPLEKNAEIERLYLELASFNQRIQELEKQHPEASTIEALKVSALAVARQIDELCCSTANELTRLLAK